MARSETEANASPGGDISDFCEPPRTRSIPHSSWGSSTAPMLETASTQRIESCRRGAPRLHRAGPRRGKAQRVVGGAEDGGQGVEDPPVDLDEGGRAVVEDRIR